MGAVKSRYTCESCGIVDENVIAKQIRIGDYETETIYVCEDPITCLKSCGYVVDKDGRVHAPINSRLDSFTGSDNLNFHNNSPINREL